MTVVHYFEIVVGHRMGFSLQQFCQGGFSQLVYTMVNKEIAVGFNQSRMCVSVCIKMACCKIFQGDYQWVDHWLYISLTVSAQTLPAYLHYRVFSMISHWCTR